jgi:hypothetical protein
LPPSSEGHEIYNDNRGVGVRHIVQLCPDCFANPQNINEDNVKKCLQSYNWPPEEIAKAMNAIKALKNKSE